MQAPWIQNVCLVWKFSSQEIAFFRKLMSYNPLLIKVDPPRVHTCYEHYLNGCQFLFQINEDSGNRRPIMLEVVTNPNNGSTANKRETGEGASNSQSATDNSESGEKPTPLPSPSQEKAVKKMKTEKKDSEITGRCRLPAKSWASCRPRSPDLQISHKI